MESGALRVWLVVILQRFSLFGSLSFIRFLIVWITGGELTYFEGVKLHLFELIWQAFPFTFFSYPCFSGT